MPKILTQEIVNSSLSPKFHFENDQAIDMRVIIKDFFSQLETAQEKLAWCQQKAHEWTKITNNSSLTTEIEDSLLDSATDVSSLFLTIEAMNSVYLQKGGNVDALFWYLEPNQRNNYKQLCSNV